MKTNKIVPFNASLVPASAHSAFAVKEPFEIFDGDELVGVRIRASATILSKAAKQKKPVIFRARYLLEVAFDNCGSLTVVKDEVRVPYDVTADQEDLIKSFISPKAEEALDDYLQTIELVA